jgi:hypothetical protein
MVGGRVRDGALSPVLAAEQIIQALFTLDHANASPVRRVS